MEIVKMRNRLLNKLLRTIRYVIQLMTGLSEEERAKKLIELDKTITEIRSLGKTVREAADNLDKIMEYMKSDVISNAERRSSYGGYAGELPQWEPSQFDLAKLKEDHLRLRELVKRRNDLEKELGFVTQ